jgi:hypothetical protein
VSLLQARDASDRSAGYVADLSLASLILQSL